MRELNEGRSIAREGRDALIAEKRHLGYLAMWGRGAIETGHVLEAIRTGLISTAMTMSGISHC